MGPAGSKWLEFEDEDLEARCAVALRSVAKMDDAQVTAHLSRDTYSHIHYDSRQARAITVREAARIQSFPDGFEFQGNRGEQFQQIGNAVPPLLSRAIAESVFAQLEKPMPEQLSLLGGNA